MGTEFDGEGVEICMERIVDENDSNGNGNGTDSSSGGKGCKPKNPCVFWDEGKNEWSGRGCSVAESSDTHTCCKCTHLTDFSLLLRSQSACENSARERKENKKEKKEKKKKF